MTILIKTIIGTKKTLGNYLVTVGQAVYRDNVLIEMR